MGPSSDAAKKQYFQLSIILSAIISFLANFFFFGLIDGPLLGGFPLSVATSEGVENTIARLVNTLVIGLLLIVPMYYLLLWIQNKKT